MRAVRRLLLADGQSLATTPTGEGIAHQAVLLQPLRWSGVPVGTAATTYATRQGTLASRYQGGLLDRQHVSVVVDLGGQSDLWADLTADQVLAAMVSYWAALRAAGADMVVATTVPHALNFALSPTQNAQRSKLNSLLRQSRVPDGLVDLAADPRFGTTWADPAVYSDGLHPTAATAAAWAQLVLALVDHLYGTGP